MRTKQSKANREARAAGKARQVRSSALGKLIIMLAVVAAIVFGVAIFFKVNTIEIQGNTVYSADQIIEASQIQPGDNLLTVNKALAVGNIKAALPYVEDVSIARSLPDGIIIQVRESTISFAVMTDTNTCWLIGPSGKALERIEPAAFNEYPHINGLLLSGPTMGQSVASPTPTALAAALDVLSELDRRRQDFVLNRISAGQVMITCCEDGISEKLRAGAVFHIQNGEKSAETH